MDAQEGGKGSLTRHLIGTSPTVMVTIGGVEVEAVVDTGSQVTTITADCFEELFPKETLSQQTHNVLRTFLKRFPQVCTSFVQNGRF